MNAGGTVTGWGQPRFGHAIARWVLRPDHSTQNDRGELVEHVRETMAGDGTCMLSPHAGRGAAYASLFTVDEDDEAAGLFLVTGTE